MLMLEASSDASQAAHQLDAAKATAAAAQQVQPSFHHGCHLHCLHAGKSKPGMDALRLFIIVTTSGRSKSSVASWVCTDVADCPSALLPDIFLHTEDMMMPEPLHWCHASQPLSYLPACTSHPSCPQARTLRLLQQQLLEEKGQSLWVVAVAAGWPRSHASYIDSSICRCPGAMQATLTAAFAGAQEPCKLHQQQQLQVCWPRSYASYT